MHKKTSQSSFAFFPDQVVPLALTVVVLAVVGLIYYFEILSLNFFVSSHEKILMQIRWSDVLVGLTIYLKTSIDFAIFIGRLMDKYPGWKNRVMIEIGTAVGNALGTMLILILWDLFREVEILMALMILIAALVLFRMAEDGLEHVKDNEGAYYVSFGGLEIIIEKMLERFNKAVAPILDRVIPNLSINKNQVTTLGGLFMLSFTVPFILGLDDFAGYIPLFNIVNVFGFGLGIFLGHTILNIFLFLSPQRTIRLVKHPVISFIGSLAFIGLGIWGIFEVIKLLIHVFV